MCYFIWLLANVRSDTPFCVWEGIHLILRFNYESIQIEKVHWLIVCTIFVLKYL